MEKIMNQDFWTAIMDKGLNWVIHELPSIVILLILTFIAFRVVRFALKRLKKLIIKRNAHREQADAVESEKRINTLMSIARGAVNIIIWTVFGMILLNKFGVNIGPILASAGILGLALGFGAQELVRDFISGFFVLLENHIREGDVAIVNGTAGTVEKIELRTITIRDFSGVVHVFQHGKVSTLANMTKEWSAIVVDVGVAYKENADHVMSVMRDVAKELEKDDAFGIKIKEEIEIFGIDKFLDSAVLFKVRIKTKPIEQWAVAREYRKRLKAAFDAQNIEIPFPHTTIYWGQEASPLEVNLHDAKKT